MGKTISLLCRCIQQVVAKAVDLIDKAVSGFHLHVYPLLACQYNDSETWHQGNCECQYMTKHVPRRNG